MATCKNCLHKDVCFHQYGTNAEKWAQEEGCKRYKDETRYFEKPCNIGDTVYYITPPRYPDNKPDLYEGTVKEIQIKANNLYYIYVVYERINLVHCIETALGTVIFFDKEAAKAALKEREQNANT